MPIPTTSKNTANRTAITAIPCPGTVSLVLSATLLYEVQGPSLVRMAASMTWRKNSSCMDLLRAAKLWRPLGGETRHRGGRWKLLEASGGVGVGRLAIVAAKAEEGMGQHHQSHMPVQPGPEPAFIVVQPQLSFGVLVEPLDYPPVVGQDQVVLEAQGVQAPGEAVFGLSLMPPAGGVAR